MRLTVAKRRERPRRQLNAFQRSGAPTPTGRAPHGRNRRFHEVALGRRRGRSRRFATVRRIGLASRSLSKMRPTLSPPRPDVWSCTGSQWVPLEPATCGGPYLRASALRGARPPHSILFRSPCDPCAPGGFSSPQRPDRDARPPGDAKVTTSPGPSTESVQVPSSDPARAASWTIGEDECSPALLHRWLSWRTVSARPRRVMLAAYRCKRRDHGRRRASWPLVGALRARVGVRADRDRALDRRCGVMGRRAVAS